MTALADALMRAPSSLSPGERELIAASVSAGNGCVFCRDSHVAIAACYLQDEALVAQVLHAPDLAAVSDKLKALLALATRVREGGLAVTPEHVERARAAGATDLEIHDTVLIAAAFCMFNRYVDGLATLTPTDEQAYDRMGQRMATEGYVRAGG